MAQHSDARATSEHSSWDMCYLLLDAVSLEMGGWLLPSVSVSPAVTAELNLSPWRLSPWTVRLYTAYSVDRHAVLRPGDQRQVGLCRGPATAESRGSRRCYEASAMGDRRHHASEDSEALFRLLQAQMDFYIFLFGID